MISELPLFVFTVFAGLSAGAYVASLFRGSNEEGKHPWRLQALCLVLLAVGGMGALLHLGRPALFFNALSNPFAGIAQEGYCTIAYGVLLIVDLVLVLRKGESPRPLSLATALIAFLLIVVTGCAYVGSLGVAAWATWSTIPFIAAGDLAMGFALLGLFDAKCYSNSVYFGAAIAVQIVFAVATIFEIVHFSALDLDTVLLIASVVVSPVIVIALTLVFRARMNASIAALLFACSFLGVCLARWAFYAAVPM